MSKENISIFVFTVGLIGAYMGISNKIDVGNTNLSNRIDSVNTRIDSINTNLSNKIDKVNADLIMRIDQSNASQSTSILFELSQQIVDIQSVLERNNLE